MKILFLFFFFNHFRYFLIFLKYIKNRNNYDKSGYVYFVAFVHIMLMPHGVFIFFLIISKIKGLLSSPVINNRSNFLPGSQRLLKYICYLLLQKVIADTSIKILNTYHCKTNTFITPHRIY